MGKGMTPLPALLILALLSETRGWVAPDFCHSYDCPEFTVVNKNDDFEERKYVETLWITVNIKSIEMLDIHEGVIKLDKFCKGDNNEGRTLSCKTWPALITMTQRENHGIESAVSVSWFFPPGTVLPKPLDTSIAEEVRPPGIVYVRSFSGIANQENALSTARKLRQVLTLAGKRFEDYRRTVAGYENPMAVSLEHHNEIWFNDA